MREAVIVSTARTPIGRAFRGALNNIKSPTLMGHAIRHAVLRAGIDGAEVEDVIIGTVLTAGTAGMNLARNAAIAAGIPVTAGAQTIDRQCASGLTAIAAAAKQIVLDGNEVVVAGGQDNISAVQKRYLEWVGAEKDPNVTRHAEHAYMPMLLTAENVVKKYGISRAAQDEYALSSQQRTARGQADGRFAAEIVPITASMAVVDKATNEVSYKEVTLAQDEGNRADTTAASLAALQPVIEGGTVTAGNASQLSDGASACVLMEAGRAAKRGLAPLGALPWHGGRRQRAGGNGHRPGLRGAETARAARPCRRRHRAVGAERGLRLPGAVLPGPARHRPGPVQRRRRRDLDRPSVRDVRRAPRRARVDRGQAPRRPVCGGHDVRRRRHGRRGIVRGALTGAPPASPTMGTPNRFLVIVRAGDQSLHPRWTRELATRDWDLVVSYFGNDPDRFRDAGEIRIDDKGQKWAGLHALLTREDFWRAYDYVWLPDDDLAIEQAAISDLFATMDELQLALAQPALSWTSHYSHPVTMHCPSFRVRMTNFVEIMAPCFDRRFLETCLSTFKDTLSGWGLDWLWPRLLPFDSLQCAIIDRATATHTRPVGGPSYDKLREAGVAPQDECAALMQRHGIPADIRFRVLGAIDVRGRRLDVSRPADTAAIGAMLAHDRAAFLAFGAQRRREASGEAAPGRRTVHDGVLVTWRQ